MTNMMKRFKWGAVTFLLILVLGLASPLSARTGKLRIRVEPSQAYVFVDGAAKGDASMSGFSRLILTRVSPGEHTVSIYNYGYVPVIRKVNVAEGETVKLDITMEPIPGTLSGPWGRLQFERGGHSAVLMNGKTPDFYVGEADDFNNDIGWKQELLVPPGTHAITLVHENQTVWSGTVNVEANKRTIVNVGSGNQTTVDWPRGATLSNLPRFSAGIASATVAVAPVTGQISAVSTSIGCGESTRLNWTSAGAAAGNISGIGEVAPAGSQEVSPTSTTTYTFTAAGPGGVQKSTATVNVESGISLSFSASPLEIRYRKQGGQVVAENSATLTWSAKNAGEVSLDGQGGLGASGTKTVQPMPSWTGAGDLDQTVNYKLTATNKCGGSETRTVAVRLVGTAEKLGKSVVEETLETRLAINSIYFPTAIPRKSQKGSGLVLSQQQRLDQLAEDFKKYLEFQPKARLILQGHADVRGSKNSNQELSERRTASVKNYLVAKGISESAIEMRGLGAEYQLDEASVRDLIDKNPNLSEKSRKAARAKIKQFILANNRRVDISLSTTGQQSARFFPYDSPDAPELLGEKPPRMK
jgi:outer membrane protein OmpA-like peptidoglycan-associated protein